MRPAYYILSLIILPIGYVIGLIADLADLIHHDLTVLYIWLRRQSKD